MTTTVAVGSSSEAAAATASPVPLRLLLDRDLDAVRQVIAQPPPRVVDHDHPPGAGVARGLHRPRDQRPPAQRMQDLGDGGAHAGALAGGEDHDGGFGHAGIVVSAARRIRSCVRLGSGVTGSTGPLDAQDPGSNPGSPARRPRRCEHAFDADAVRRECGHGDRRIADVHEGAATRSDVRRHRAYHRDARAGRADGAVIPRRPLRPARGSQRRALDVPPIALERRRSSRAMHARGRASGGSTSREREGSPAERDLRSGDERGGRRWR